MDHANSIQRLYDLNNNGDLDGFGRQVADGFTEHEEMPGFPPTKAGKIHYFRMSLAAFPDLHMVTDDVIAKRLANGST